MTGPFQRRTDGDCSLWSSFKEALAGPYDKVSFDVEGGRLILRSDGTWEYWTEGGRIVNGGYKRWAEEQNTEKAL